MSTPAADATPGIVTPPPAVRAAAPVRLLTVADLAALPTELPSGDVRYELNDGVLVVMPPPGDIPSYRQAKIVQHLGHLAEDVLQLGRVRVEAGIVLRRDPDRVVGADGAFILNASLPVRRSEEGYLETIPEVVIEVRSKYDRAREVWAKVEEYFAAGVKVLWVLDNDDTTVTAHRPDRPPVVFSAADTLTDELLPGFAVPVAKLFPAD
jgi:Uma2 family endonuclease